jgi:integrase
MSAHVAIVIRTRVNGRRTWLVTKDSRRLGEGESFYIRWKENGRYLFKQVGVTFFQAEQAALTQEKVLKGEIDPPKKTQHRIKDSLASYTAWLQSPRTLKSDNRTYRPKAIRERLADINEFNAYHKQHFVEQIRREDLLGWKNSLTLHANTIRGKLSSVNHWLQWAGMPKLLKKDDWPRKSNGRPKPYTAAEVDAQLDAAHGRDHLMLRVALYGFRKMELATLERSNVSDTAPIITIQAKPDMKVGNEVGWEPKTLAGCRDITVDSGLWEDLKALPDGLIFPAPNGEVDVHLDRIFEAVGKRARIRKPAGSNVGWCHRWRHTAGTEMVRNRDLSGLEILRQMGWQDYKMLEIYAQCDPEAPHVMAAANKRARLPKLEVAQK